MELSEAKRLPGSRWVGVTLAIAWAVFGVWFGVSIWSKPFAGSLPLAVVVVSSIDAAVVFALTRIGPRNLWPSLRGHRLSALLLLVWSLAVVALWLEHWNISTSLGNPPLIPAYTDVWDLRWGWGLLYASVPFLAGSVAAWWQLTDPETAPRFRSGLAAGVVAGVVSMAALALGYWVAGAVSGAAEALGYLSMRVAPHLEVNEAIMASILVIPGGALVGLLGGLVGDLAAMVSRRSRGRGGIRRPA